MCLLICEAHDLLLLQMKIAIDCRSLRKRPAGVPNFLLSFIHGLSKQQPGWTLYLMSNEPFHSLVMERLRPAENVHIKISRSFLFNRIAIAWYLFTLPRIVRNLSCDIFYTPIPNLPLWLPRVRTCVTVHDMVYKLFPGTMSVTNRAINWLLHDRSLRKADWIWAVSRYTAGEVEKYFP